MILDWVPLLAGPFILGWASLIREMTEGRVLYVMAQCVQEVGLFSGIAKYFREFHVFTPNGLHPFFLFPSHNDRYRRTRMISC